MAVCANCEWTVDGNPVVVAGNPFCCTGCAGGGPCTCAYANTRETPSGEGSAGGVGRVAHPSGWALVTGDRTAVMGASEDSVLPAPRRARLGTDGT